MMRRKYEHSHRVSRAGGGFSINSPYRTAGVNDDPTGRFYQRPGSLMRGTALFNPRFTNGFRVADGLAHVQRPGSLWPEPATPQPSMPPFHTQHVVVTKCDAARTDKERIGMTKKQYAAFVATHFRPNNRRSIYELDKTRPLPVICARICKALQENPAEQCNQCNS